MKKLVLILLISIPQLVFSQVNAIEDEKAIDLLLSDLYGVISGPAGERDWQKFKSLFYGEVVMGNVGTSPEGQGYPRLYDPDGYIQRNGDFFRNNAFYEEEIGREINIFGSIAQVFTAYQFRLEKDGSIARRGINSIQMIKNGDEWLITQLIWQEETPYLPIPENLLLEQFRQ